MPVSSVGSASAALALLQSQAATSPTPMGASQTAAAAPADTAPADLAAQVRQLTDIVGRVARTTADNAPLDATDTSGSYSLTERVNAWKALQIALWNTPDGVLDSWDRFDAGNAVDYSGLAKQINVVTGEMLQGTYQAGPNQAASPSQLMQQVLANFNGLSQADQQLWFQAVVQDPLTLQADGRSLGIGQGFQSIADYTANLQANVGITSLIENALANGTITGTTQLSDIADPTLKAAVALYADLPSPTGGNPAARFQGTPFLTVGFTARAQQILAGADPAASAPTAASDGARVGTMLADGIWDTSGGTTVSEALVGVFQGWNDAQLLRNQARGSGSATAVARWVAYDNAPNLSIDAIKGLIAAVKDPGASRAAADSAWNTLAALSTYTMFGLESDGFMSNYVSLAMSSHSIVTGIVLPLGGQILDIAKYAKPVRDAIMQAINTRPFSAVSMEALHASVMQRAAAFDGAVPSTVAADKPDRAAADDIGSPAPPSEPSAAEQALALLKQASDAPASIALQMLKAARKRLEEATHAYAPLSAYTTGVVVSQTA